MFLVALLTWLAGLIVTAEAFNLTIEQYFGLAFLTLGVAALGWSGNDV